MRVAENFFLLVGILAVLCLCAGLSFGLLMLVQALGLEADTFLGRLLSLTAALGGVVLGIWLARLAWIRMGKR